MSLRPEIEEFCVELAADPLLVQGAGGNVSWKEDSTLWVKASGTCLRDAQYCDIFAAVDLLQLRGEIAKENFSVIPQLKSREAALKPSIETLLHALMPQPIVVHLHAVEVLACLVRASGEQEVVEKLGDKLSYLFVDYFKPGAELAQAISLKLATQSNPEILFLKNHGIVVGGKDVSAVRKLIYFLSGVFYTKPVTSMEVPEGKADLMTHSGVVYSYLQDSILQQLVFNHNYFEQLYFNWALYPDHVVFLGHRPHLYNHLQQLEEADFSHANAPDLIFIENEGIFVQGELLRAKCEQLHCYYGVLSRQSEDMRLNHLNHTQVEEITDSDAEKYRQSLAF